MTGFTAAASGMQLLWEQLCWLKPMALVGGEDAWLIIDDTALPKKGRHSVGVALQDASARGRTAHCQLLVSVAAAREVPVMVVFLCPYRDTPPFDGLAGMGDGVTGGW